MKLRQKLFISFLVIGLLPAIILGIFSLNLATEALNVQAYNQLTSIRSIKKQQIESYFDERQGDLNMLIESIRGQIGRNPNASVSELGEQNSAYFEKFINTYGYYDLFLIDDRGEVFYSVTKEADYQTNLVDGKFSNSGLGQLFKKVQQEKTYHLSDFKPYQPSNNDPAAFIAMSLSFENHPQLVIALQLSSQKIGEIMQQRDGMGETGESYLVGEDLRMRSDSFLDPEHHSLKASFAGTVEKNGVDTEASKAALSGEESTRIVLDYNNNPVLSAYTPLTIQDVKWALMVDIDEAEAMLPVKKLQWIIGLIFLISLIAITAVAFYVAKKITHPLGGEPDQMQLITEQIAAGDLTVEFCDSREKTGVYGAMSKMSKNLLGLMTRIIGVIDELSNAANQASSTAEQSNQSIRAQQVDIENVSCAMTQMSTTIEQVANSAKSVADSTQQVESMSKMAHSQVTDTIVVIESLSNEIDTAAKVISSVEENSQAIGSILEVIRGVADQTNLLALNAAIEAARAGDQGRGFAVVADEVRELAQKTQVSTLNIKEMIELLQTGTQRAVAVMENSTKQAKETVLSAQKTAATITDSYEQVQLISNSAMQIASGASQQSYAAEEVNKSLVSINQAAQQNASGIDEINSTSKHLNSLATDLQNITGSFTLLKAKS